MNLKRALRNPIERGQCLSWFLALTMWAPTYGQQADITPLRERVDRGNQYMQHHQYAQAMVEYEAAAKLDPKNSVVRHNIIECHNNWGIFYYRQKNYEAAIGQFEKTLALDPRHGQARYNLSLCKRTAEQAGDPLSQNPDSADGGTEQKKSAAKPESQTKGEATGKDKAKADEPSGKLLSVSANASTETQPSGNYGSGRTLFGSMSSGAASSFVSGAVLYPKYSGEQSAVASPVLSNLPAQQARAQEPAATPGKTASTVAVSTQNQVDLPARVLAAPQESGASIDERLTALELKVYGKRQGDLSVIKRLEKLEMETAGEISAGSISDRIQALKKNIGL